uniref:TMEM131_like domain-containing protein n=1 Tax=Parastrongyloides trichosuri TaxID=131310 RepID=A0A0N4Z989_PARTI
MHIWRFANSFLNIISLIFFLNFIGDLYHNSESVSFHTSDKLLTSKVVLLQNSLPFGVAVHGVKIINKSKDDFQVNLISKSIHIAPGDTAPTVRIKYLKKKENGFETQIKIYTNVSNYELPIKIYNGEIEVIINSIDKSQFDFGTLSPSDERVIHFDVRNDGTVPVSIEKFYNPLEPYLKVVYIGQKDVPIGDVLNDNKSPPTFSQADDEIVIRGRNSGHFKLILNLTDYSPLFNFHKKDSNIFKIITKFQVHEYRILFNVSPGGLLRMPPERELNFGQIFPGQVVSKRLFLFSYFPQKMNLLRLSTLNNQGILFFESNTSSTKESIKKSNDFVIQSGKINDLNRVLLMPHASCNDHCYIGMQLHSSDGQWFTYGMKLPQNLAEIDYYLYKNMRSRYERLVNMNKNIIKDSIVIDTTHVKNYEIPVKAEMVWPRLMTTNQVIFPLTAVGNYTIMNLTIQNPSLQPVIVQLLPLVIYPDADAFLHSFKEFLPPMPQPIETNETLMFSLRDTELFTLRPDSPVPRLREDLESIVNTPIPRFTLSMLLQPGMKVRIRLGFLPTDHILRSSLLIIRNNLTVVEPVVLMGRGAHIDMEIDGKIARTKDPLLFDIQPFHLSDCNNPKRLTHKLSTTLTVKRSFMVKNTGEIAFTIVNMSINNYICENRGFRVLNCDPFTLKPNETHILDIAYTPDFLMSWNEAALQLYMHMNGTSWMFPIAASIPKHMLAKCYSALPRPPFEGFMYYSCVSALIFCLICVIACAYLEGDRTISHAIRLQYMPPKKVFDFKDITSTTITSSTTNTKPKSEEPVEGIRIWRRILNYFISCILYVCNLIWHEKITAARLGSSLKEPAKDKKKAVNETLKLYQETTRSIQKTAIDTFKMRNPGLLKRDIDLSTIDNGRYKENNDKKKEENNGVVKQSFETVKENNLNDKVVTTHQTTIISNKNQKGKKKGKGNKSNVVQNNKSIIVDNVKEEKLIVKKDDKDGSEKYTEDEKNEIETIFNDVKDRKLAIKIVNYKKELRKKRDNIEKDKIELDLEDIKQFINDDTNVSLVIESLSKKVNNDKEEGQFKFVQNWVDSTKDDEDIPENIKSSTKKEDLEEECSFIDEEETSPESEKDMNEANILEKYKELKMKYAKDVGDLFKKTLPPTVNMDKVIQAQKEILTEQFNMPIDDVAHWDPNNPYSTNQIMDLYNLMHDIPQHEPEKYGEYMSSFNMNSYNNGGQGIDDPWNIMGAFTPGQNFFPPDNQIENLFTTVDASSITGVLPDFFQNNSFTNFDRTLQMPSANNLISQGQQTQQEQQRNSFPISSTDEFNIWNPLTQENSETFDSWMKHTGIDKIIDEDEKNK